MPIVPILVSVVLSLATVFGVYNYVPADLLQLPQFSKPTLGSTITTILGTDTLSASRSVINTNFSNLNTDKLQSGDTASALTITTLTNTTANVGTLNLTNALTVANGGTGSTTLSSNQVLLGNGTSLMKTVSGWGTSGQFLTSNGGVLAPTWQSASVDQTANYAWTGVHNFVGSATYIKNLYASSTPANPLFLNTLAYDFPSVRSASSTIPMEDGSGHLTWNYENPRVLKADGSSLVSTGASATTTVTIPAGVMGANSMIYVLAMQQRTGSAVGKSIVMQIGDGTASTTIAASGSTNSAFWQFETNISNNGSLSSQYFQTSKRDEGATFLALLDGTATINTTNQFYISWGCTTSGGETCNLKGFKITVSR